MLVCQQIGIVGSNSEKRYFVELSGTVFLPATVLAISFMYTRHQTEATEHGRCVFVQAHGGTLHKF